MGAHEQANERRVGPGVVGAGDHELHLHAGPFEFGRDRQSDVTAAVGGCRGEFVIAIRAEVGRGLERSFAPEKRIRDSIRPKVDVDAIRMNLNASDERSKQVGGCCLRLPMR